MLSPVYYFKNNVQLRNQYSKTEGKTYEFVVLEVGDDFLSVSSGSALEGINTIGLGLLQLGLNGLHVALEVSEEALFVELGGLETERVDNVVDLGSTVLNSILLVLGGRVSTC